MVGDGDESEDQSGRGDQTWPRPPAKTLYSDLFRHFKDAKTPNTDASLPLYESNAPREDNFVYVNRRSIRQINTIEIFDEDLDELGVSYSRELSSLAFATGCGGGFVSSLATVVGVDFAEATKAFLTFLVFAVVLGIATFWMAIKYVQERSVRKTKIESIRRRTRVHEETEVEPSSYV